MGRHRFMCLVLSAVALDLAVGLNSEAVIVVYNQTKSFPDGNGGKIFEFVGTFTHAYFNLSIAEGSRNVLQNNIVNSAVDNPCTQNLGICHENAKCINPSTWLLRCECFPGYSDTSTRSFTPNNLISPGTNCSVDIDECSQNATICGPETAKCINTAGSYTCDCPVGYNLKENICNDIDECVQYATICGPETARCINTAGSYTCECPDGYKLMNNVCEDINECDDLACTAHAECYNTVGSYYCSCMAGYKPEPYP